MVVTDAAAGPCVQGNLVVCINFNSMVTNAESDQNFP
jgi:hypothetical protein